MSKGEQFANISKRTHQKSSLHEVIESSCRGTEEVTRKHMEKDWKVAIKIVEKLHIKSIPPRSEARTF